MKAMKCDRCKKYYDTDISDYPAKELSFKHIILTDFTTNITIDLCPDCRKSFDLWLKGGVTNE